MASTFKGRIEVNSTHARTVVPGDTGTVDAKATSSLVFSQAFAQGVDNDQAQAAYSDNQETATATTTYNLFDGSLVDGAGLLIAWTELKAVCVVNYGTVSITVGGGANPINFTGTAAATVVVPPGGCFLIVFPAGAAAAIDATHKNLLVTVAAAAKWKIQMVGNAAA